MNKEQLIYIDANEKYLAGVMLYATADDAVLTYDKKGSNKVAAEELKNLFIKGLIVVECENKIYKPVTFEDKTTHYEIAVVGDNMSSAETKNFKSDDLALDEE